MKTRIHKQRGVIAILYGLMVVLLIGMTGLAVDLGLIYYRKTQLQNAADSLALAAALRLNGTPGGVTAARNLAAATAVSLVVGQSGTLSWSDAALRFSADPDAPDDNWLDVAAAMSSPANLRYARVDTRQLAGGPGLMRPAFMGAVAAAAGSVEIGALAVAGPRGLNVLPFAICAMSDTPSATRVNSVLNQELVEYGFRYGVGYNLLQLNPAAGAAAGDYFLVDPIAPPGATSLPENTSDTQLAPFICSGKLAYASLAGGRLNLRRPGSFDLWPQLNSRFDSYGGTPACNPDAAPPDTNIRAFTGATAGWMNNAATLQTAQASTPAAGQPLRTIADAPPPLPAVAPPLYGVLWAYGAARRSSGSAFGAGNWQSLYPGAPPMAAASWPAGPTPYRNAAYTTAPSRPGRSGRRLLYVPLLACPVDPGQYATAPVRAVARFLMTAPATSTELSGEFAGVVAATGAGEPTLTADVELIR